MYTAELASIISQFGKTEMDFNLIDDQGVMPDRRVSFKWVLEDKELVDEKEISQVMADLCIKAEEEYLELQGQKQFEEEKKEQVEVVEAELKEKLAPELEAKFQEFLTSVEQDAKLSEEHKKIARGIKIEWRLE